MKITEFLKISKVCHVVFYIRFYYFTLLGWRVSRHRDLIAVNPAGMEHNYQALKNIKLSNRILKIIKPLSSIDRLNENSRILVIGCRFECDILYLIGYGFKRENITAIDLYSYSPWIRLGNMHSMSFPDNHFDATILGWVLTYSDTPSLAANEVFRVTRKNGLIAIGLTVEPYETLTALEQSNKLIGTTKNFRTTQDTLGLFGSGVGDIFFRHDPLDSNKAGHSIVIFATSK
jgi:hypothetical protein